KTADVVHPVSDGVGSRNLPSNETNDGGDRRCLDQDHGRDHYTPDDERSSQFHAEARPGSTRCWCSTKTRIAMRGSSKCGQYSVCGGSLPSSRRRERKRIRRSVRSHVRIKWIDVVMLALYYTLA